MDFSCSRGEMVPQNDGSNSGLSEADICTENEPAELDVHIKHDLHKEKVRRKRGKCKSFSNKKS